MTRAQQLAGRIRAWERSAGGKRAAVGATYEDEATFLSFSDESAGRDDADSGGGGGSHHY